MPIYAIDWKKICSHAQSTAMVIELCFFMKKMICENHVYLYFIHHVIFSSVVCMQLLFHMFFTFFLNGYIYTIAQDRLS